MLLFVVVTTTWQTLCESPTAYFLAVCFSSVVSYFSPYYQSFNSWFRNEKLRRKVIICGQRVLANTARVDIATMTTTLK